MVKATMYRTLAASLLSVAVIAAVAGCSATSAGGETNGGKGEIGFFSMSFANPYEQAHQKAIQDEAKSLGYTVTVYDANNNGPKQYDQVETALSSGRFAGFIIDPVSSAVFPAVTDAGAQGIKVYCALLTCGKDPASTKPQLKGQTGFAGVSEADSGVIQAKMLGDVCKDIDPCKVAYVQGSASAPTDQARTVKVKETLADFPNVRLVSVVDGQYDTGTSYNVSRDLFSSHPDLVAVAGGADQMLFGVQKAAAEAGVKVAIIGNAGSKEGVQAVCDKKWVGAAIDLPVTAGKETVKQLVNAIEGKHYEATIDPRKTAGKASVTQADACSFHAEWSASGK